LVVIEPARNEERRWDEWCDGIFMAKKNPCGLLLHSSFLIERFRAGVRRSVEYCIVQQFSELLQLPKILTRLTDVNIEG